MKPVTDSQIRKALGQKRYPKWLKKRNRYLSKYNRPRKSLATYGTVGGMPLRKFVKLNYFEQLVFTPNLSGAQSSYAFNLASAFDPNFTGTGHQPLGYDQFAAFYKQYRVHSATITVQWSNAATNVFPVYVGMCGDKSGSLEAPLETKMEAKGGRHAKLLLINSREKATFRETVSIKDYFSVKNVSDDHQLQALITGSPTLPAYYVVWAQFANGHPGTTSNAIIMSAKINFSMEFFDPVELAQS